MRLQAVSTTLTTLLILVVLSACAPRTDARAIQIGREAQAAMGKLATLTVDEYSINCWHDTTRYEMPGRVALRHVCGGAVTAGACVAPGLSSYVVIGKDLWVGTVPFEQFRTGACANFSDDARPVAPQRIPIRAPLLTRSDDSAEWETVVRLLGTVSCVTGSCYRLVAEGTDGKIKWHADTLIDVATAYYVSQDYVEQYSSTNGFTDMVHSRIEYSEWGTSPRIVPPA